MFKTPNHLRPRREKVFGDGPRVPLDREAKLRIKVHARAKLQKTEAGKAYGIVTAKALAVLDALLWGFHNARSGQCDPSYDTIAERAGCARSTVALAIKVLEVAGLLTWVNRITREWTHERDLFGHWVKRWRIVRMSNAYLFCDPKMAAQQGRSSKSENRSVTTIQDSSYPYTTLSPAPLDPDKPLDRALLALGRTLGAIPETAMS